MYSEVEIHEGEDEALQILHEVEEGRQSLGIGCFLHVRVRAYLRSREDHLFLADSDHQLLLADLVRLGPLLIARVHYPGLNYYPLHLIDHSLGNVCCVSGGLPCFRMS